MSEAKPLPRDLEYAAFIGWLRAHKLEAHTDRKGNTAIMPRQAKINRNGEKR